MSSIPPKEEGESSIKPTPRLRTGARSRQSVAGLVPEESMLLPLQLCQQYGENNAMAPPAIPIRFYDLKRKHSIQVRRGSASMRH